MPTKNPAQATPPAPVDDGACRHLASQSLPRLTLPSTRNRQVSLRDQSMMRTLVVFIHPRASLPGKQAPPGWETIPGADGTTQQALAYRAHQEELTAAGTIVFGVNNQGTDEQKEFADHHALPFEFLSDAQHQLQTALRLPTFETNGKEFLRRVTLVCRAGRIAKAFYPVHPVESDPEQVLAWIRQNMRRGT